MCRSPIFGKYHKKSEKFDTPEFENISHGKTSLRRKWEKREKKKEIWIFASESFKKRPDIYWYNDIVIIAVSVESGSFQSWRQQSAIDLHGVHV